MASTFLRKPGLGASPLEALAKYFEQARKGAGMISVPSQTERTIKEYRDQGSEHSTGEVETIVQALEAGEDQPHTCTRLDQRGLAILCSIFVYSKPCLAQQRGFYLLAEALHTSVTVAEPQSSSSDTQIKKCAFGSYALVALIKGFTASGSPDQTRKWMGVLALELLKDCSQNANKLKGDYIKMQSLSSVIKHGRCQVLKLLAGSMINIMLNHGITPEVIWPRKEDLELYSKFPRAEYQNTQWITCFEGFVESLGLLDVLTQECVLRASDRYGLLTRYDSRRTSVIFAYGLLLGDSRYSTDEEPAILVTVSEDLNIIIPDSAMGPATYIDVPLSCISSVTIESQVNSQSQTPFYNLTAGLSSNGTHSCIINAAAKDHSSIALVFNSETEAKTLERLLQPKLPNEGQFGSVGGSPGIEDSKQSSESEPEASSSHSSPSLEKINPPTATVVARIRSPNSVKPVTRESQRQGGNHNGPKPHRSMSTPIGLEISQTNNNHNIQANVRFDQSLAANHTERITDQHQPATSNNAGHGSLDGFKASSKPSTSSSMRQRNGSKAIESAPEFQPQVAHPTEQQATEIRNSQHQTDEYDSAYRASPRKHKTRPQLPKDMPPPPRPNLESTQKRRSSPRINHNANQAARASLPATSDSDLIPKPQYPPTTNKQVNGVGNSSTGQAPTSITAGVKLTKRLRNADGKIDVDQEPSGETEHSLVTKAGTQKKAKAKPIPKSKAPASTKTKGGVQKQAQPIKKATMPDHKAKAVIDHLSDSRDEYDLQASPEVPKHTNLRKVVPEARAAREATANTEPSSKTETRQPSKLSAKSNALKTQKRMSNVADDKPARYTSIARTGPTLDALQHEETHSGITESTQASNHVASQISKPKSKIEAAAPVKQRSRRGAAIKANMKIQRLEEDDGIADVDAPLEQPTLRDFSAATERSDPRSIVAMVTDLQEPKPNDTLEDTDTAKAGVQSSRTKKPSGGLIPLHPPRKKAKISRKRAAKSKALVDSSEESETVSELAVQTTPAQGIDASPIQSDAEAHAPTFESTSPRITTKEASLKKPENPDALELGDDSAIGREMGPAEQACVPNSVPKVHRKAHLSDEGGIVNQGQEAVPQGWFEIMGENEDSHFQEAMGDMEEEVHPSELVQPSQNHITVTEGPLTPSGIPKSDQNGAKEIGVQEHHEDNEAQDPFQAEKDRLISSANRDGRRSPHKGHPPSESRISKTQNNPHKPKLHATETRSTRSLSAKQLGPRAQKISQSMVQSVTQDNLEHTDNTRHRAKLRNPANGIETQLEKAVVKTPKPATMALIGTLELVPEGVSGHGNEPANMPAPIISNDGANGKAPLPIVSRKANIVSWSPSGPRNQGTISGKKAKPGGNVDSIAVSSEKQVNQSQTNKRKTVPYADDPAPLETEHLAKRRKLEILTPRKTRAHVPKMVSRQSPLIRHDQAHRLGSQSSKVDENGSPLPPAHPQNEMKHTSALLTEPRVTFDDGNDVVGGEDEYEIGQPRPSTSPPDMRPVREEVEVERMVSNPKHHPSSPSAPSTITTHVRFQDGELINKDTLESIKPIKTQDPFVGGVDKPPSSFVKMLRQSTDLATRRQIDKATAEKSPSGLKRKSMANDDDDPDKTLVEPEPKQKRQRTKSHVVSQNTSMWSGSTSRTNSKTETPSEDEEDYETRRWRKALEPHQANMLDVLSVITHRLVRHLVDKEMAARDILKDYQIGGKNLLDGYERERQKALELDSESLDQVKMALSRVYGEAQTNIRKSSNESTKRRTRGLQAMEAKWEEHQEGSRKAIDAALAACFE